MTVTVNIVILMILNLRSIMMPDFTPGTIRAGLVSLLLMLISSTIYAGNKVVVVPLGDDATLSKIVTVAKQNGQFKRPQDALASITDASAQNPYLMVIGPGLYDMGEQQLIMKDYVSIQGAGIYSTILQGDVVSASASRGLVEGATARLSELSIWNLGEGSGKLRIGLHVDGQGLAASNLGVQVSGQNADRVYGILVENSQASFSDVISLATKGSNTNYAVYVSGTGKPRFSGVTAVAKNGSSAAGFYLGSDSTAFFDSVKAYGFQASSNSSGIEINKGQPTVKNSQLYGQSQAVYIGSQAPGIDGFFSRNQMLGGISNSISAEFRCNGNFDADFAPVAC